EALEQTGLHDHRRYERQLGSVAPFIQPLGGQSHTSTSRIDRSTPRLGAGVCSPGSLSRPIASPAPAPVPREAVPRRLDAAALFVSPRRLLRQVAAHLRPRRL